MATAHRLAPPFQVVLPPRAAEEPRDPTRRYTVAPGLSLKRRRIVLAFLLAIPLAVAAHLGLSYGPTLLRPRPLPAPGVSPPDPDPIGTPVSWWTLPAGPQKIPARAPGRSTTRSRFEDYGSTPPPDDAPAVERSY